MDRPEFPLSGHGLSKVFDFGFTNEVKLE
jgi:hypothetical protein